MSQPATLTWFARHELRLFWRDWISMLTAGKRRRESLLALVAVVFLVLMHLLAYHMVAPLAGAGADKAILVAVTGSALLSCSMMISQAMEAVTRAFYARSDLDLILTSPASARRIFAVRMVAVALSTAVLTLVLAGPFINALAVQDGPRWLAAYGLIFALATFSTALAVVLTVLLFRSLGPKRTRSISQIVSAVIGAAFVIGVQAAAIVSIGSFSRLTFFRSEPVIAMAPELSSVVWWPARAAMGELGLLAALVGLSLGLFFLVVVLSSSKFGDYVVAAAGVVYQDKKKHVRRAPFRQLSIKRALRRKEWTLLLRDPWLMSETLMQILYLLPPALLLWLNFGESVGALLVLVPVLVMAAGQLAGGLAWLAVSGEDAPDLMASAPVPARTLIAAKVEAVLGAVALVVAPLLAALALAAPKLALVAALGIAVAAASGTMIQIWFRAQAKRSHFRRRQTSSRVATLAEALSSIAWAGTAALVAAGSWFAIGSALVALVTLSCAWTIRPRRENGVSG